MKLSAKLGLPVAALALAVFVPRMQAENIVNQTYNGSFPASISGTLPNQGAALEESFAVASTSNLTAYTNSYASGGFEPNLLLFDAQGNMVALGVTPGTSPVAKPDMAISPQEALDGYLTASALAPGNYTLTLTDWQLNQSLTATKLSDGFTANYGNGTTFIDEMGNVRTGNYALALDLTPTSASATPEPATLWLTAPLLLGMALLARKRAAASR